MILHQKIQKHLFKKKGFCKLGDRDINMPWWNEHGLDKAIDTFWTFEFEEYNIRPGSDFTKEDVMALIDEYFGEISRNMLYKKD